MTNKYNEGNDTRTSYEKQICEVLKNCMENGDYRAGAMILDQDGEDLSPENRDKYRKQLESKLGRIAI
jgi:hypothetical protein